MILVSGLDYSGTSLTAGILHHLGVDMGQVALAPPPPEHPEQVLAVAAGGHLRTWPSYEDETVMRRCAHGLWTWEPWERNTAQAAVRFILATYARAHAPDARLKPHTPGVGLKTNFACVLSTVPGAVTRLIMTRRDEAERRERCTYYTHTLLTQFSRLVDMERWCREGYARLLPQADYVVDFDLVRTDPAAVVADLVAVLGLHPQQYQIHAAIKSVLRMDRKEAVCQPG